MTDFALIPQLKPEDSPWDPITPDAGLSTKARIVRRAIRMASGRAWNRFVVSSTRPLHSGTEKLLEILQRNRDTQFGREHGFSSIRTIEEYQRSVPIRGYSELEPWITRMVEGEKNVLVSEEVPYFAQSSGTTGTPKFIPITPSYLKEFLGGRLLFARALAENIPQIADGEEIGVVSPKILGHTRGGVPYGSITGKIEGDKPGWVKNMDTFPAGIYELDDFDLKYYLILRIALERRISRINTPNPSTVVLLATKLDEYADRLIEDLEAGRVDRIDELAPDLQKQVRQRVRKPNPTMAARLRGLRDRRDAAGEGAVIQVPDVWKDFCAVICWKGGSAPFYLQQFPRWFGDRIAVHEMGYLATEGSFTLPLSPRELDGVLMLQTLFAEFIPEEERDRGNLAAAVDASRVVKGGRYYMLVTNSAGLYRYDINDIVEVTGFFNRAPRLRFLHKGGNMISITGEKLGESHVVEALREVQRRLGIEPAGFTVSVDLDRDVPRYLFYVEGPGDGSPEGLERLLRACDDALKAVNLEYEAKRDSQRLDPPELIAVAPGSYEAHRKERLAGGAPDAHVKPLHLTPNRSVPDAFPVLARVAWPDDADGGTAAAGAPPTA